MRILNLCCAIAAMSLGARDISLKACVASDVLRADPLIIGEVWGYSQMTSDACMQYGEIFLLGDEVSDLWI